MSLYNMTYFSKNKNVQSQLYATGGATTLTLSGFNVGTVASSVPLAISGLQSHFHSNYSSIPALSNTAQFYPPGADNSLLYAPTVTSLAFSSTLSANQAIDANSRGFYVVVIGGGGGGGGGRYNSNGDNGGYGAYGGGSGGLVGYYFNFADNGVSVTGAYYRYTTGSGGAGGAKGISTTGATGGNGSASQFILYNSANTQIFSITCGGGTGSLGANNTITAAGGTRSFTGTAANIATQTTVNVTHSINGNGRNNNAGGAGGTPVFLLQNIGGYEVVNGAGNGGAGGNGDNTNVGNFGSNGLSGVDGKILLFTLY